MARQTYISPIALPGRPYKTFAAKALAAAGPHLGGPFTELSVTGLPGARHSFVAKVPGLAGPHTGLFTELSVMALPGARHSFSAKTEAAEEDEYGFAVQKRVDDDALMWISIITPIIDEASKN